MSKLPSEYQFLDLSDYGRPFGKAIAKQLQHTRFHAVHVTFLFVFTALVSLGFLWQGYPIVAAVLLVLKSIIDAADGELARLQNRPSYIGRYLDSVSDILINLCLMLSIGRLTNTPIWIALLAFASLQLQGTLYNYYYVILRNVHEGDTTSRIFEQKVPKALGAENQKWVNILYYAYKCCYGFFDKIIYTVEHKAATHKNFPQLVYDGAVFFWPWFSIIGHCFSYSTWANEMDYSYYLICQYCFSSVYHHQKITSS
jgi:hypothetical protein